MMSKQWILTIAGIVFWGCINDPDSYSRDDFESPQDAGATLDVDAPAHTDTSNHGDSGPLDADSPPDSSVGDVRSDTSAPDAASGDADTSQDTNTSEPGDVSPEPDIPTPDPLLLDCDQDLVELPPYSSELTLTPLPSPTYADDPFSITVMPRLDAPHFHSAPVYLGIELIDRTTGDCVTFSEDACSPLGSHTLFHGKAPAPGDYCVVFTTRPDNGTAKLYHAAVPLEVLAPPDPHVSQSCMLLRQTASCSAFDTTDSCAVENEGSCTIFSD